jgi:hypothetical protein
MYSLSILFLPLLFTSFLSLQTDYNVFPSPFFLQLCFSNHRSWSFSKWHTFIPQSYWVLRLCRDRDRSTYHLTVRYFLFILNLVMILQVSSITVLLLSANAVFFKHSERNCMILLTNFLGNKRQT